MRSSVWDHGMRNRIPFWSGSLAAAVLANGAAAQTAGPPNAPGAIALRCLLSSGRAPEVAELRYFYLDDTRRIVSDLAGNDLGSVLQYTDQRIVIYRANAPGGPRTYTFDRMIGALTITAPPGARDGATLAGACEKVDASRQKF